MPPESSELSVSVGEFVALMNQTLEFAIPDIIIEGELANFRVSKNRWAYFDLKDDTATVRFFGTVYQLPGPLEDGMVLRVRGQPRLHPQYNFSVNVMSIQPAGEGTIRRAAELLLAKLTAEGIFDESRKRPLPYPPKRIGLISSKQSAAYADFMKILKARWQGLDIEFIDVQVQGEVAPLQIVSAIDQFNARPEPPDVLILIRGGGSPEDLAAFSTEQVCRAVAGSRVPTLVAIGHETDVSLAELAADRRASTPSNAAELLVPDREAERQRLRLYAERLEGHGRTVLQRAKKDLHDAQSQLHERFEHLLTDAHLQLAAQSRLLEALSPQAILRRGYAIVRHNGTMVRSADQVTMDAIVDIRFDGSALRARRIKDDDDEETS